MKNYDKDFENYIQNFPVETQQLLTEVRMTIKKAAPLAVESFTYGMPTFKTEGKPLVYFAGYKTHIGFYATPSGHQEFAKELAQYKQGKGSVQFPLNQPIPIDLIKRITLFRVEENSLKAEKKKS